MLALTLTRVSAHTRRPERSPPDPEGPFVDLPQTAPSPDAVVIGVDYGTLSGRAVVVRVRDGAELASAVLEYPHAVLDRTLPDGTALPPEFALQVPADYVEVLRRAVPEAVRRAGIDPADVIGIGTDFTACTMVPTTADGTPLNELDGLAGNPHAYVKLWRHHAAQPQADRINALAAGAQGGLAAPLRRADLLRVGVRQGPGDPRGGSRGLRHHGALGRGRRLDRLAADRRLRPQRVHRRLQGHLPGRQLPLRGLPGRAQPRLPRVRRRQGRAPHRPARRACRAAQRRGGRVDRAARGHRRRRRQRRRARDRAGRARRRAGPDGGHHGHLHLPRHEQHRAARGAGHVRRRRRRHRRRPVGLRGRAERRRRHLRLVRQARRAAGVPRGRRRAWARPARAPHRPRLPPGHRRARPGRPRLAQRQPVGPGRPRAVRAGRRPDAGHPRRGHLPRAAGGHGLRHPHHRRGVRRRRRPGHRARRRRRPAEEPAADADLRRRDQPAVVHHRLRAGPGAGLGHPRRGRRRRLRRRARGRPGDGPLGAGRLPADPRQRRGVRRAVRRVHAAARPLRPRRQRRHAPAPRHPAGGDPVGRPAARRPRPPTRPTRPHAAVEVSA